MPMAAPKLAVADPAAMPPLATIKVVPNVVLPPVTPVPAPLPDPLPPLPPPTAMTRMYYGTGLVGVVYVPEPEVNFCTVGATKFFDE